jgi:hypothetical protein
MKQDLFDHFPLINHRKHSHPVLAMRANQRVGVPDLENDIPPFLEGSFAGGGGVHGGRKGSAGTPPFSTRCR